MFKANFPRIFLLTLLLVVMYGGISDGHKIKKRKHLTFTIEGPENEKNLVKNIEPNIRKEEMGLPSGFVISKETIEELVKAKEGSVDSEFGDQNLRPIVGILAQETDWAMERVDELKNYSSYIAASYVKFIESAGARVVPIRINQDNQYYETMAKSLNGFLFPGGGVAINNSSGYGRAGKKIFDLILASGKIGAPPIPLWTTCLGFEMILYLTYNDDNAIQNCSANNRADKLIFDPGFRSSKLFGKMSKEVIHTLQTMNITSNFHKHCVLPSAFNGTVLGERMRILTTSLDDFGVEYVSTVEHRQLPIFGTQWHPEKTAFEWAYDKHHNAIPHNMEAVRASYAIAEVFIQETRKNQNKFSSCEEEKKSLIYNYQPIYVQPLYGSSFEQCYYFD